MEDNGLEVVRVEKKLHPRLRLYTTLQRQEQREQEANDPKKWRIFYTQRVLIRLQRVQDILLAVEVETDWKTLKWLDYLLRKAICEYREAVDLVTY